MVTLARRLAVLIAFAFWQGGFTFYASVVVPIGAEVMGSARDQGFITRRVAGYINLAGAVALVPLAWDAAMAPAPSWNRRLRWLCWLVLAVTLALLAWLHPRLDELLDLTKYRIIDRALFRGQHRWYLWISTIQWGFGLGFLVLSLMAWRRGDGSQV